MKKQERGREEDSEATHSVTLQAMEKEVKKNAYRIKER